MLNAKEIEMFEAALLEILQTIQDIKGGDKYIENYKKSLLLSLIDMMSKCAYPKNKSNRVRFVSFIQKYSEWKYSDRISIPNLLYLLAKDKSEVFTDIQRLAQLKYSKWKRATPITLDNDLSIEEVQCIWPTGQLLCGRFEAKSLSHVEIFWRLRNSLIHEMRIRIHGYNLFKCKEPHYSPMIEYDNLANPVNIKHKWVICYPYEFYLELAQKALVNLISHLREEEINPYKAYEFGEFWIDTN